MRFGIFLQPLHHPSEHPTLAMERDLSLLSHLDELGFEEAWIGEHHSTGWENIGSPEVFIAAAAQRTQRMRLGTGVIQLGLHNPLVLLDRMILLDHLTRGRAMFGVGVGGGLPSDLKVFGLDAETAGRRFNESIDAITRLLNDSEPVSMSTEWFELQGAVLQLAPFTKPHMPFAVASTNSKNLELMGELGGQVLLGPIPERVPEIFEHIQRGAERVGRAASRDQIVLSYRMHMADSRDEALESYREGSIVEQVEFNAGVNGRPPITGDVDEWYASFAESMLIGAPDDVGEKIERIVDISGGIGGILFQPRDWAGPEAGERAYELFARKVAPHFQGHSGQQVRAAQAASDLNTPA